MTTSPQYDYTRAERIAVYPDKSFIIIEFPNGLTLHFAFAEVSQKLTKASQDAANNWCSIGKNHGIRWPEIDEDISIKGLYDYHQARRGGDSANAQKS